MKSLILSLILKTKSGEKRGAVASQNSLLLTAQKRKTGYGDRVCGRAEKKEATELVYVVVSLVYEK